MNGVKHNDYGEPQPMQISLLKNLIETISTKRHQLIEINQDNKHLIESLNGIIERTIGGYPQPPRPDDREYPSSLGDQVKQSVKPINTSEAINEEINYLDMQLQIGYALTKDLREVLNKLNEIL